MFLRLAVFLAMRGYERAALVAVDMGKQGIDDAGARLIRHVLPQCEKLEELLLTPLVKMEWRI